MKIQLITVPHTGTWFTIGLLNAMGVEHVHQHVKRDPWTYWRPQNGQKAVVTLRDPMLAQLSAWNRGEEYTVAPWRTVARWIDAPGVHFFAVDGPTDRRGDELAALAAFVGAPVPGTSWEPVNAYPDQHGLRSDYVAGAYSERMRAAMDQLAATPGLSELFIRHGYELPWMGALCR